MQLHYTYGGNVHKNTQLIFLATSLPSHSCPSSYAAPSKNALRNYKQSLCIPGRLAIKFN